jgi:uncharacterized RDD family membrane protein YckC
MDQAEPPSRYPPAEAPRRLIARAVDLTVAFAPLLLVPRGHPVGGEILSAALLLCNDSLFGPGRSLGKRLAGLRVIALGGRPAGIRQSALRNWLFVIGLLPALWGRALPLVAAALACVAAIEACVALLPLTRDLGQRRLGDLFARTQVIDASIAAGAFAERRLETARATAPLASRAARQPREKDACASR